MKYKQILNEMKKLCDHKYKPYYIEDILIWECAKCNHKIKFRKEIKSFCEKFLKIV